LIVIKFSVFDNGSLIKLMTKG